jgi:hypothetical protein
MKKMRPLSKADPMVVISDEHKVCDQAFALACRYSRGQDLVEEMVASDFWPLGRRNETIRIEMVQVPVFGPPKGLPFPCFDKELDEGRTKESFLEQVESYARGLSRR